ncbi:hypothetical protein [Natronohydrobacter thiooxidans]|uniref:hypothetical protein n=1 Tax=Natronohydrobacter thiooxidans TaxID=87172 RepID=UPI001587CF45|nr:hypothetical protein [Natronohydrobacter thiooxidans]
MTATLQQKGLGIPLIVTTPEEALVALGSLADDCMLRVAVVQMPAAQFAASSLCAALRNRSVPVIILDDGPPDAAADLAFPILALPFFTEDLERILEKLVQNS